MKIKTYSNRLDHSITFVIILFVLLLFSAIQIFAQEKEGKMNKVENSVNRIYK